MIAASSGTAEFFAASAVAERLLHMKAVLRFFCLETHAKIKLDSSAAKGITNRERVGRVCSLEARVLWPQQAFRRGFVELETVPSDDNLADLGAKTLRVERLENLRIGCGIVVIMADVVESQLAEGKN